MKKTLAILLALVVVGGAAFAQVTVNGYERSYAKFSESGSTIANRLRLNLSFNDADGNFGFWGRLQAADFAAPTVPYAYGWINLADKKVKVTGGLLGNYDYDFGSGTSDYALGNVSNTGYALDTVSGGLIQIMPVDGANIGVWYLPGVEVLGGDLKYEMKDVATFVAEGKYDFVASEFARASVSAQLNAVKDLSATAGYKYATDAQSVYGIVDYTMGDAAVEVAPEYSLTDSTLYVEGYLNYTIKNVKVSVLGAYDQGGATLGSATAPSTYFGGLEVYYNVGKSYIMTGFNYDEVASWKVPVVVRVSF